MKVSDDNFSFLIKREFFNFVRDIFQNLIQSSRIKKEITVAFGLGSFKVDKGLLETILKSKPFFFLEFQNKTTDFKDLYLDIFSEILIRTQLTNNILKGLDKEKFGLKDFHQILDYFVNSHDFVSLFDELDFQENVLMVGTERCLE